MSEKKVKPDAELLNELYEFTKRRNITFEHMKAFIFSKHPEDKEEFKKAALITKTDKNGKEKTVYNHSEALKWFCKKYDDEFEKLKLKVKNSKKVDDLLNW